MNLLYQITFKYSLFNSEVVYNKTYYEFQRIPEGPRLPEMNYDSLPEFLKRFISTENPVCNFK